MADAIRAVDVVVLHGPQGPQGETGAIGPTGPQGPQGPAIAVVTAEPETIGVGIVWDATLGSVVIWDGSRWIRPGGARAYGAPLLGWMTWRLPLAVE